VSDTEVVRVAAASVLVQAIARVIDRVRAAAASSIAVSTARHLWNRAAQHAGITLATATGVHVLLVGIVNRPGHWYWLVLPSIAGAVAVVLVLIPRRRSVAPVE
jgi:hypothetical protein